MNLKELKEIIDLVTSKDSIEELEVEKSGVRIRIKRASGHVVHSVLATTPMVSAAVATAVSSPATPAQISAESADLVYIKSPIVGTFYKAPTPTSDPFVSVGQFVEKGSVLCIIEAMKLMNEIESEAAGEIVAVLVQNGQPVEYGEKLFAIRPR
jgi:acetyl-CoA carboxylase biotin carboxyl carrier protein